MNAPKPVPLSLRQKTSARVAAVQCGYRLRITSEETTPEALLEDYIAQWKDDKKSGSRVISRDADPDKSFLRKLLSGVMERHCEIEDIIRNSLGEKWTMERMSPLLVSILACAIFEMKFGAKLAPSIIIDEYVTLTGRFFEAQEVGFVNGLLDTLAKEPREE